MSKSEISQRVFLVGCARSGTTLLQSLLAAHPEIASFPESSFFQNLFAHSEPKRKLLGLASRRAKPRLRDFLTEIGHSETAADISRFLLFPDQLTRRFIHILDQLTVRENKTIWLEKTPTNLYFINYINQQADQPKFIHIVRNGEDVVASLFDVRKKYPKAWSLEPADIDLSIQRWVKDAGISLTYLSEKNHIFVRYEALVKNPEYELKRICNFLNLSFDSSVLKNYRVASKVVSLSREPWKQTVGEAIRSKNSTKFYELFNQDEQNYIREQVSKVDLSAFNQTFLPK
ncbi:MAG: sulfotransferase [Leptolyngbya sp. SIO4C1]|nr:sulfotransferase [Leptolyngbya sp. SIO4C1]